MNKISAAGLLLLAMSWSAWADSLEDFNHGLAASNHGDNDSATTLLSRVLSGGDLSPNLQPEALVARGEVYRREHKFPEAIADYDAALKLKPQDFEALSDRAHAFVAGGNTAAAATDCLTMTKLLPNDFNTFAFCGRLDWEMGNAGEASKKLETALEFSPRDQYSFLWFCLVLLRSKPDEKYRLPEFALALDTDSWPSPLVDLYLGNGSLERAERKVSNGDDETRRNRACEVGFYGGEWQLLQGNAAAGRELLKRAADRCLENSVEFEPTRFELERLGNGATQ